MSFIQSNNYAEDDANLVMSNYLNIIKALKDDEIA